MHPHTTQAIVGLIHEDRRREADRHRLVAALTGGTRGGATAPPTRRRWVGRPVSVEEAR